jgi:hypothetical protein
MAIAIDLCRERTAFLPRLLAERLVSNPPDHSKSTYAPESVLHRRARQCHQDEVCATMWLAERAKALLYETDCLWIHSL